MSCLIDRICFTDIEGRTVRVDLWLDVPNVPTDLTSAALSKEDWEFLTSVREVFARQRYSIEAREDEESK